MSRRSRRGHRGEGDGVGVGSGLVTGRRGEDSEGMGVGTEIGVEEEVVEMGMEVDDGCGGDGGGGGGGRVVVCVGCEDMAEEVEEEERCGV